jgi:hypothetical protein
MGGGGGMQGSYAVVHCTDVHFHRTKIKYFANNEAITDTKFWWGNHLASDHLRNWD